MKHNITHHCSKCDRDLPSSEFYSYIRKSSGKQERAVWCKVCSRARASAYGYEYRASGRRDDKKRYADEKKNHPDWREKRRDYELRHCYGITQADYERMYAEQEGKCAVCLKQRKKKMDVDHDHKTKKVRGLVCRSCNLIMGLVHENYDVLLRAGQYLMRHSDHVNGIIRLKA